MIYVLLSIVNDKKIIPTLSRLPHMKWACLGVLLEYQQVELVKSINRLCGTATFLSEIELAKQKKRYPIKDKKVVQRPVRETEFFKCRSSGWLGEYKFQLYPKM